ncbi:DUF309 domain-containing protein [Paenibacillus gansuensis]|uniref:DUF309 domain-containing protein n=1 Tax=Paenibacillus gansuensis TaxID=306542 RepID=A0ABW5PC01_9BACL
MVQYPEAYVRYLIHFHTDRDYFECHEVLEEFWKEHPEDARSELWVGLIQLAVAMYHERRGNCKGAVKMLSSSFNKLIEQGDVSVLGLNPDRLSKLMKQRLQSYENRAEDAVYRDLELPFMDLQLLKTCRERAGEDWNAPSRMNVPELVHKHIMRDRTQVIAARAAEMKKRAERSL